MVFLVLKGGGRHERTTMSWARYMMCVHLGRILDRDEHVDHIDENKLNDVIENFQILTHTENSTKNARKRGRMWVELLCLGCGERFHREKNKTHLYAKRGTTTSCSRSCSRKVQCLSLTPEDLKTNIIREYRKH